MDINQPMNDVRGARPSLAGFNRLSWAVSGLCEEAGEVAGILNKFHWKHREEEIPPDKWKDELGDVLWYLAQVANCKGYTLQEIWEHNQQKLLERYGGRNASSEPYQEERVEFHPV